MSSKQTMVESLDTERGLGAIAGFSTADSVLLSKAFPQSPINNGTMTDGSTTSEYEKVLDEPINDGGYYFGEYNPKFVDAPNLDDVETGAGGLPATPFVPNVASPGEGSNNPTELPDPPNANQAPTNATFGAGGGTINPSKTSEEIAKPKLGDYMMPTTSGKSMYTGD